jgi:hypothetical protein
MNRAALKWVAAILAPYLIGIALFFTIQTPIWPALLISCAIASVKDWRPCLILAIAVVAMQFAKHSYSANTAWVYYSVIYLSLGVFSSLFVDRVLAWTGYVIAAIYASNYFSLPAAVIDTTTEPLFYVGLIAVVLNGPTGGNFRKVFGIAAGTANRGISRVYR